MEKLLLNAAEAADALTIGERKLWELTAGKKIRLFRLKHARGLRNGGHADSDWS
jgi:hypothetical protein